MLEAILQIAAIKTKNERQTILVLVLPTTFKWPHKNVAIASHFSVGFFTPYIKTVVQHLFHTHYENLSKTHMKTSILISSALLSLSLCATSAEPIKQPNIIIFYVDDLGWQDVQLNDLDTPCAFETPNITKLAKAGMNFTDGYSPAPTCAPSRAGIITGQHPAKIAMTHVTVADLDKPKGNPLMVAPYLQDPLDRDLVTLADVMNDNGYRTGHSGKWHVGLSADSYGFKVVNQDRGPHRSMEDRTKDFATADDAKYPLSKEKYPPFSDKKPDGISYPYEEVTESALKFIGESGEKPFFLNLCHWMVHWPAITRNGELLEHYCDKLGQAFPPKPGDSTLPGQQNPYFSAMVTTVDWSLGRVVDYLEKTDDPRHPGKKLIETTYIFFSSDNGGAEARGPEILSDNAPLKYGKGHAEEGGVRVPMIIAGPGIEAGSTFNGLVNQLDYFPTILKLTESSIPENDQKNLSGADITPVLTGASEKIVEADGSDRDHLFWHFPHGDTDSMMSSIRSGDYKLYKRYMTNDYLLYQIHKDGKRHDIEEAKDLAKNPEFAPVLESLSKMLEEDLKANNAELPYLNALYTEKETPAASLGKTEYDPATRIGKLSLKPTDSTIKKSYVIYCNPPSEGKQKKSRSSGKGEDKRIAIPGMRASAEISEDGQSVQATIPEGIEAFCFMIVDANNYMQFSKICQPSQGDKKGSKKSKKKAPEVKEAAE